MCFINKKNGDCNSCLGDGCICTMAVQAVRFPLAPFYCKVIRISSASTSSMLSTFWFCFPILAVADFQSNIFMSWSFWPRLNTCYPLHISTRLMRSCFSSDGASWKPQFRCPLVHAHSLTFFYFCCYLHCMWIHQHVSVLFPCHLFVKVSLCWLSFSSV